jgi:hypothetical protein
MICFINFFKTSREKKSLVVWACALKKNSPKTWAFQLNLCVRVYLIFLYLLKGWTTLFFNKKDNRRHVICFLQISATRVAGKLGVHFFFNLKPIFNLFWPKNPENTSNSLINLSMDTNKPKKQLKKLKSTRS